MTVKQQQNLYEVSDSVNDIPILQGKTKGGGQFTWSINIKLDAVKAAKANQSCHNKKFSYFSSSEISQ